MTRRSRGESVRRPDVVVQLPGVPAGSMPPEWPGALCAQSDPDAWFPEAGGSSGEAAKRICRRCPHRAECLAWALEAGERFGIWGGLTAHERRRLARDRSATSRELACEAGRPRSVYPPRPRPSCHPDAEYVGGPVVLWCSRCGRDVHASTFEVEPSPAP